MDAHAPINAPAATAAKTRKSTETGQECAQCGWPFGPDLCRVLIRGTPITLCINPWRCRKRAEILEEHLREQSLTSPEEDYGL